MPQQTLTSVIPRAATRMKPLFFPRGLRPKTSSHINNNDGGLNRVHNYFRRAHEPSLKPTRQEQHLQVFLNFRYVIDVSVPCSVRLTSLASINLLRGNRAYRSFVLS